MGLINLNNFVLFYIESFVQLLQRLHKRLLHFFKHEYIYSSELFDCALHCYVIIYSLYDSSVEFSTLTGQIVLIDLP